MTDGAYFENTTVEERSVLMSIPGMLISRVWHDSMHGQNLGTGAYLAGNTINDLDTLGVWGEESQILNLRRAHMRFKAWVKSQRLTCSTPMFTPNSIGKPTKISNPELDCKAHDCKLVIYWLAEVTHAVALRAADFGGEATLHRRRLIACCCYAHAQLWHIMDTSNRWFTDEQATEFHLRGYQFLLCYSALTRLCCEAREVGWMLYPKFHLMTHMLDKALSDKQNPRFTHCFGGEDFVMRMARIGKRCHRSTACLRSLQRWLHCSGKRFLQEEALAAEA